MSEEEPNNELGDFKPLSTKTVRHKIPEDTFVRTTWGRQNNSSSFTTSKAWQDINP